MRDDRNAMFRRTFQVRYNYNGFMIKKEVMKDLGIKNSFFYALSNLIKVFIPDFLMRIMRKSKMNN